MPHVRPTSHHRGQPDRGWTPHRRHGNGSRPMHMVDSLSPRIIHHDEAGSSLRSRSRGNFVAVRSGASPRLRPYMNPGRKNRGSPSARIGISMRTTPSNATEPSLRTVTVQRHGSAGGPVSSVPVDFDGKTAFIKTHIPSRAVGSSGGTFQSHSYLIAYFTAHIVLISSQNVAIMRQNNTEVHSNYS